MFFLFLFVKEKALKEIFNWRKATVGDIESDGLLDVATKLHVLSYQMQDKNVSSFNASNQEDRIKAFFKWHIDNKIPVVFHNGKWFDIPLVEKMYGIDLSELMVIDTLPLSWYLNIGRKKHGLDSFFEDYGIAKPKVDDWENLSYQEYQNRCVEDVKINKALWEDFKERLIEMYSQAKESIDAGEVGGTRVSEDEVLYIDGFKGEDVDQHINRILTFLMFKADCAVLQEKTMWEVDVPYLQKSEAELKELTESAARELEGVMPPVPKYVVRKSPAKMFKKSGELSAIGERWKQLQELVKSGEKDEFGNLLAKVVQVGEISELASLQPPNINSVQQVKEFLLSKGWVPQTFKYVRDDAVFQEWIDSKPREGSKRGDWTKWKNSKPVDRAVSQITVDEGDGKELCPSILDLAEAVPEVKALENYSMIKHRLGTVQGFLSNLKNGKFLQARIAGYTNTLRVKHTEIVNLPKASKPFAAAIRGCLVAGEGKISLGADLSGIEDRCKHNFMIPHDPEYVATMMEDDYDPHIATAFASGSITAAQAEGYKLKTLDAGIMEMVKGKRAVGKTVNYASVYKAGAAKIAITAKISKEEAEIALGGYWKLNWAVLEIEKEQVIITDAKGGKWLLNPINGHLYSLRSEKDIFSTLAQGTGSYFFDMWVDNILEGQFEKWGRKTLTASWHDEVVLVHKDSEKFKQEMGDIVKGAIDKVSGQFMLRRKLGCEVQFGQRYSEIH